MFLPGGKTPRFVGLIQWLQTGLDFGLLDIAEQPVILFEQATAITWHDRELECAPYLHSRRQKEGKMSILRKAAGPKILCACVFGLLLFGLLQAQQTGEIRGKIADEQGEALPGVAITAKSPKLQGVRTALSDKDGNFRLPLLPVGSYSLTCELDGFERLTTLNNEIHLGFTLSVSVILKTAAVSEEVIVTAENPLIDKINADNSYRLKGDDLARVPSQARTIEEVVSFTPGVTGVRDSTVTGTGTGLPSFRGEGDAGNNWLAWISTDNYSPKSREV